MSEQDRDQDGDVYERCEPREPALRFVRCDATGQREKDKQEEDELIGVGTERAADVVGVVRARKSRHVDESNDNELQQSESRDRSTESSSVAARPQPVDGHVDPYRREEAVDEDKNRAGLCAARVHDGRNDR